MMGWIARRFARANAGCYAGPMTKIHYLSGGSTGFARNIACGRYLSRTMRATEDATRVTCLDCQGDVRVSDAATTQDATQAYNAIVGKPATPVIVRWTCAPLVCRGERHEARWESGASQGLHLHNVRVADRFWYVGQSCMGHYDDYVCASCGATASVMTDTGRCF